MIAATVFLSLPAVAERSYTPRRIALEETGQTARYTGPGSCASSACHGSVTPRSENRVLQNEYSTWIVKDKHSKAYASLEGTVGERMAAILGVGKAESAPKCLACHALDVPVAERARTFDLSEGVSCENCHGPAAAWLGPHTERDWTHQKSLAAGMYDTRDLTKRSEKMPDLPSGHPRKIGRPRNDRRRASRSVFRARFFLGRDAAPLERAG